MNNQIIVLKKVLHRIRRYWASLIASLILATIYVVMTLYIPILVGSAIDCIVDAGRVDFAAMAGYDPQVAVSFWQRMAQGTQSSIPAFLSDHPSDAQRIADIKKWMPEALKYYKPAAAATAKAEITAQSLFTILFIFPP